MIFLGPVLIVWIGALLFSGLQPPAATQPSYVGSQACARCHTPIYDRWKQTRMANVVRDPREHPDAIVADFSSRIRS